MLRAFNFAHYTFDTKKSGPKLAHPRHEDWRLVGSWVLLLHFDLDRYGCQGPPSLDFVLDPESARAVAAQCTQFADAADRGENSLPRKSVAPAGAPSSLEASIQSSVNHRPPTLEEADEEHGLTAGEIQQYRGMVERCEAGVIDFSNDDMSNALVLIERLRKRFTEARKPATP